MLEPACCSFLTYRWRGLVRMAWVRLFAVSRLESPARAELELVDNIAAGTGQLQSVQLTQHSTQGYFLPDLVRSECRMSSGQSVSKRIKIKDIRSSVAGHIYYPRANLVFPWSVN